MELYQIRYFLAVVDTLSFTRASQRAFVSQPALTKAIQRLEELVGGRLIDRNSKPISLTHLGHEMLPSFRKIYDSTLEARERARQLVHQKLERVEVGIMCTIGFQQLIKGFASCNELHPDIDFKFQVGSLEMLTVALDLGDIDLAILASPQEFPKRFTARPMFSEHFVFAIGDDHRFNGRQSVSLSELHRENYCDRTACEFSSYIDQLLIALGVNLNIVQESDREDLIAALVRTNFGSAFMPESIAKLANLAYVHLDNDPIVRNVRVLSQTEKPTTTAQQMVLDYLSRHAWTPA